MSYYSTRHSYSGLGSSYSSYRSSSSYDSSSWRNSYSNSSYKTRTYDFGSSSFLSKNYGSDTYSRKYDEYSWKAKDLLTDNPRLSSQHIDLPEIEKLKFDQVKEEDVNDEYITADVDHKESDLPNKDEQSYSSKSLNYRDVDEVTTKDNKNDDDSSTYSSHSNSSSTRDSYHTRDDNKKYSSKRFSTDKDNTKDNTRTEDSSDLSSKGYTRNRSATEDAYQEYLSKRFLTEKDLTLGHGSSNEIIIRGSGKKSELPDNELKKYEDGDTDINMNYVKKKPEKEASQKKKVYNFEDDDDDVFVTEEKEISLSTEKETIFDVKKNDNVTVLRREIPNTHDSDKSSTFKKSEVENRSSKSVKTNRKFTQLKDSKPISGDDTDSTGPLRMHYQGITKFISAVPDEKRYISTVNFLPDRIELRFCGALNKEKKLKKCRSITDLYAITVRPQDQQDLKKPVKQPWDETIQCTVQDVSYSYDNDQGVLHFTRPQHEHTKEMYITQYTHRFNSDEPRTHIAGWKVDVEPNGIPHEKSRMCVLKSPVIGDSRRRAPRPKSAPPQLSNLEINYVFPPSQKVNVVERGTYSLPRRANRLRIPDEFMYPQKQDVVEQESFTSSSIHRAGNNLDSFFHSSMDDSQTEDVSSVGYAPSDDTSDSSAFFFNDPRYISRYPYNRQPIDPNSVSYSKPRLIRLSAEFPGIRNLEKMRRKRQSMGSASSGGSRSSVGGLSPKNGEYGFFVALTSGDPRDPHARRKQRYSYA